MDVQSVAGEAEVPCDLLTDEGTNSKSVLCLNCGLVMLRPGLAQITTRQMSLPCVYQKKAVAEAEEPQTETLEHHWIVDDMYTFENVGFTKAANGAAVGSETMLRYLACGDCGTGPIGWHSPSIVPHEFFVALSRVKHE
uniref:guanine nucleotide exchange factor MSS4-like n=1 Tax=Myxine glutinosa TaxID=7769 RepID=UPI00358ECC28